MAPETQAAMEVAHFIASRPSPEQIIAFRPSPEVVERIYALVENERDGQLSAEDRRELESYLTLQHLMILAKAEAQRQLLQQAS